jgi:integrase
MNSLRQSIEEYLAMRRSLGFKLREAGQALADFAAFMERRRASYITQALALSWAQEPAHAQPAYWASRLCHVRQFARYRSASDPRTQIPAMRLLPFRPKRARPYLYSDKEIQQLLHATLDRPLSPHCPDRERCALLPWVYYCLFGLLSVSGLRLGEARNLKVDDLDLNAGVLTVRGSKFGKDRWIPLHASTSKVLAKYLDKRQRHWTGRSVSPYLFVSSWGNRLDIGSIHRAFYAASRRIGLRGAHDSHGPRLHDLRHRFATTTLVNWYRAHEDPERRLPLLSAYLGHVHVADTQWYLSGSPELMREAMRRLEHRWGKPS